MRRRMTGDRMAFIAFSCRNRRLRRRRRPRVNSLRSFVRSFVMVAYSSCGAKKRKMPFERRPHANCKGILASRIAERHGKRIYRGLLHPIPIPFPHSRSRSSPLLQGSQTASQQQPPVQKNLTKIARDRVWQRGQRKEGRKEGGREQAEVGGGGREGG